ncbi:MAG: hypothetical protein AB8B55_11580 [Mariniblastus sp.]
MRPKYILHHHHSVEPLLGHRKQKVFKKISISTLNPAGRNSGRRPRNKSNRNGVSSIDLVLLIAIILPLIAFLFTVVPRMITLVYEMSVVIIGAPFM